MSEPIIKINDVNKWFGDFQVLKNINLDVNAKQKIVVCGPSGSGKSTLIRCINRLEEHQEGTIIVDGNELNENTKNIEEIRAEVGMVFQQFNLFPHLSILDTYMGKKNAKKEGRRVSFTTIGTSSNCRPGLQISRTIIWWSTTKISNCKSIVHGAKNNVV